MNNTKGFTILTALFVVLGFIALGGAGYVAMNPELQQKIGITQMIKDDGVQSTPGDHPEVDRDASGDVAAKIEVSWRFESAGEVDAMPYTNVTAVINGGMHDMGKFVGSCSEVGASGGIDGKGLLAGELSAAQCWFAGGGKEIGVFAHEDGGYEVMVGELSEGEPNSPMFRGDFKVKTSVAL
jgi:hypothetical protein